MIIYRHKERRETDETINVNNMKSLMTSSRRNNASETSIQSDDLIESLNTVKHVHMQSDDIEFVVRKAPNGEIYYVGTGLPETTRLFKSMSHIPNGKLIFLPGGHVDYINEKTGQKNVIRKSLEEIRAEIEQRLK